jgi:hypothetical protein
MLRERYGACPVVIDKLVTQDYPHPEARTHFSSERYGIKGTGFDNIRAWHRVPSDREGRDMNPFNYIKGRCDRHALLRFLALVAWFTMSVALLLVIIFANNEILDWVDRNPFFNKPLLFFATLLYIVIAMWFLRFNFSDDDEDKTARDAYKRSKR